ncbi:MAG TPA: ABC transporter permease [Lachnospiraceae bacterium]|nr:ABC transporter permease [Lachnospiraceae bacterium]
MNVFNKITLEQLKKNKVRTAVTIIGVMLSAAMICAVTTIVSSFQNYMQENIVYVVGDWHGVSYGTDRADCEEIRGSEEVSRSACDQQLGFARIDSKNEYKPYMYVIGAAEGFEDVMPVHMVEGRLPESSGELILPQHLGENGGVAYAIGDTLTLDLGSRMMDGAELSQRDPCFDYDDDGRDSFNEEELKIRESRTYTVVGIYERPSFEDYMAPGYTAITRADEDPGEDCVYDVYFKMKNPKRVFGFMDERVSDGDTNTDLLMLSGAAQFESYYRMLYGLAAVIILLIMFGSVSLIYNAFSIAVSERTKQFGLLASIGATRKQIRHMVFFEAVVVALIGIPLGILAGIGGIGVTLLFIGNKFANVFGSAVTMRLCVSPAAVVTACVVAFLTVLISAWIPSRRAMRVSAIEAIRQASDIQIKPRAVRSSKLVYRIFGLPGMLASKYYRRSRKKYRATVVSLVMSIVLFVSASAFTEYLMESVGGGLGKDDYDLRLYVTEESFTDITDGELLEQIREAKDVTAAASTVSRHYICEVDRSVLTDDALHYVVSQFGDSAGDGAKIPFYTQIQFVDDTSFREMLGRNGLDEQTYMNPDAPLAVVAKGTPIFDPDQGKYITLDFLKEEQCELTARVPLYVEGYYLDEETGEYEDKAGNQVYRYLSDDDPEETREVPAADAVKEYSLHVGKILTETPWFLETRGEFTLLYPQCVQDAVVQDTEPRTYHYLAVSDDHGESYAAIRQIITDSRMGGNGLVDYAEQEESNRNIILIIQVFSYGFIVLISLIAAANVFNTISTNIALRRREFAMLKSVGMTRGGFNGMMNFECLLYGFKSLLYGLPLSAVMTYMIFRSISEGYATDFHMPWGAVGIAVFSVFAVVFVTMMYAMSKVKKDNPIDALKNENI